MRQPRPTTSHTRSKRLSRPPARAQPFQDTAQLELAAGRQLRWRRGAQLIEDGLSNPAEHMARAAILQPPANFADPLSGDMAATLSFMAVHASELVAFRAERLALLKDMASNLSSTALVKSFAGKAYTAMGKSSHMALMEWLQIYTGVEDTAVP
eukprot:6454715-Amphidinium_carterae.2